MSDQEENNVLDNGVKKEPLDTETFGTYEANTAEKGTYYSANNTNVVEEPKESRALEICSLVFGILGIVCCCCYGLFGLVGLILSIIALATGKKSGLSIAGLVCSIVGILLTVLMFIVGLSEYGKSASEDFMQEFSHNSVVNEAVYLEYSEDVL